MLSLLRLFSICLLLCLGIMVHAMPISSYEENMIESLRLKGLDEKEIELLIRPRLTSPSNTAQQQHAFSHPVTTIDTQPLITTHTHPSQQRDDEEEGEEGGKSLLSLLWRLVPGHEWGDSGSEEGMGMGMGRKGSQDGKRRNGKGKGGDGEEDFIVVTGRMGKLKVSRA